MTYFLKPRPNRILVVFAVLLMGATACTTASRPDLSGMSFSSEPLLGKVIWHDLITEDIDSSRNFYGELFGWTFENHSGARGEEYFVARKGDVIVAGLLAIDVPADAENYSRWLPYISVDDVDAALSRSIAGGASVAAAARELGFGRVALPTRDANGKLALPTTPIATVAELPTLLQSSD